MEKRRLTCIGAGDFNFDIVVKRFYPEGFKHTRNYEQKLLFQELGGNCGNVMCELSYYGWHAMPVVKINRTRVGEYMLADLKRFGADTRFVDIDKSNTVKLFKTTHNYDSEGNHTVSFQGLDLSGTYDRFAPSQKHMGFRNGEYKRFLEELDFVPDVFFMGKDCPAYLKVAQALREKGSLIFFEKNSKLEFPKALKHAQASDIIKFSRYTLPDVSPLMNLEGRHLIIQTMDEDGVRFKLGDEDWVTLPPIANEIFKDGQGAGDCFTSAFINALGVLDILSVDKMTIENITEAVNMAQTAASHSVEFVGTKTFIYEKEGSGISSNGLENNDFLGLLETPVKKPVEKLDDIPEKDYREYDINKSHGYRSDYDCVLGKVKEFDKKEINPLSNFYECSLSFQGMNFFSAEQLYHYLKFTGNKGIQHDILECNKSKEVKHLCQGKEGYADHNRTRWMHMTLAMEVKYLQCKAFRDIVRSSGNIPLVEVQESFDVHGATVKGSHNNIGGTYKGHDVSNKYVGMNGCGRCLMAIREKFRNIDVENGYDFKFNSLDEWWNESPIYSEQLDDMGKK